MGRVAPEGPSSQFPSILDGLAPPRPPQAWVTRLLPQATPPPEAYQAARETLWAVRWEIAPLPPAPNLGSVGEGTWRGPFSRSGKY